MAEHTKKKIVLPDFEKFGEMTKVIRTGGSGFSQPAADLVEFLISCRASFRPVGRTSNDKQPHDLMWSTTRTHAELTSRRPRPWNWASDWKRLRSRRRQNVKCRSPMAVHARRAHRSGWSDPGAVSSRCGRRDVKRRSTSRSLPTGVQALSTCLSSPCGVSTEDPASLLEFDFRSRFNRFSSAR